MALVNRGEYGLARQEIQLLDPCHSDGDMFLLKVIQVCIPHFDLQTAYMMVTEGSFLFVWEV